MSKNNRWVVVANEDKTADNKQLEARRQAD